MKARATLTLRFPDSAIARTIAESVSLDDQEYVQTRRKGTTITATAEAEGALSLLRTLDDYLACVSVAERTADAAGHRKRRP